jgi:hypothetical protein
MEMIWIVDDGLAHIGHAFPFPFTSLRTISGGKEGLYVIGAMFTEDIPTERSG